MNDSDAKIGNQLRMHVPPPYEPPTIHDASLMERRLVTQDDIDRLEALGANFFLTKRIIRKMLDFPHRVPNTTAELWQHHELLKKMMSLIDNGHVEG